ncbi:hypothetical protein BDZ97DRAFT_1303717 [Flammula alnicola]|nr:hypothetical protein BDZ97DRAFT_1303717 [Flammula alnicola]
MLHLPDHLQVCRCGKIKRCGNKNTQLLRRRLEDRSRDEWVGVLSAVLGSGELEGFCLNGDALGISGLMSFSEAWEISMQYLYPQDITTVGVDADGRLYGKDLTIAGPAFNLIVQCRKLPTLPESFLDDMRKNFHLMENEISQYMALYELEKSPEQLQSLVARLMEWYKAWAPPTELGPTLSTAYTLNFQTRLFSSLPLSFAHGFKELCTSLLAPSENGSSEDGTLTIQRWDPNARAHTGLWKLFKALGLIDRYESVIASVGYEFIEDHVLKNCTGEWHSLGVCLPEVRA